MGEKTTVEIENMRELKQHALDTNKTIKQIINEAIAEKIAKERGKMARSRGRTIAGRNFAEARLLSKDIAHLERILQETGARSIVVGQCNKYGLDIRELSPKTISKELIEDIDEAMRLVFSASISGAVRKQMERIAQRRG